MTAPPRLDAHQHFWRYSAAEYGWITPALGEIRRDFLVSDLAPHLAAAGLGGSIAVQARSSARETDELLALARGSLGSETPVLGVVGWLDLAAPDVEAALDRYHAEPLLVGLRHVVQDEPDDRFLDRPDFRRGVLAAAARDLVYDVLVYPRQLPAALDFVQALEGVPMVLDHCAKPPLRAGHGSPEMAAWERGVRELARAEHLACKVSGLVTEADWASWREEDVLRCIDVVLETFGPERVLYGSDWPVALLAAPYTRVFGLAERAVAACTPAERAAFFGGNAARIYGIG
jgi:L-fuconolactonase